MFKVSISSFESVTQDLLQATQDIRVVKTRTEASINSLLGKANGNWIKSASYTTSRFKRRVGVIQDELEKATSSYAESHADLIDLKQKQGQVFGSFGLTALDGDSVILDSDINVRSYYQTSLASADALIQEITNAQAALRGLDGSLRISTDLSTLEASARGKKIKLENSYTCYKTYKQAVKEFESSYSKKIGTDRFPEKSGYDKVKDFFSDWKSVTGIPKHIATVAGFFGSLIDKSHSVKKYEGVFKGTFDFARPSKWKEAWQGLKTGAEAQKAGSNAASTTESITGASKTTTRVKSAGKILGYVGTALTFITSGFAIVDAYNSQEGDTADKMAAGTLQTASEAAKFVAGKAAVAVGTKAGAAIGTAVCPVVGTIAGAAIGFVIGVAADYGINKLSEWSKNSGFHDKAVKAVGNVYRSAGKFISNGWKKLWGS